MNESLLKKEFKESDVQRARNLVNKNFTGKTKIQTGYQKSHKTRKEGDVWEENGKQWTIKNGLRQNVTKLDSVKNSIKIPLTCPKCKGTMKHHLSKKMYKIHGFCFDCTINMEAELRKVGLYDEYEKKMMSGNIAGVLKDIESWVMESLQDNISMVTEQGDAEEWADISNSNKEKILQNLKEYTQILRQHI